MIDHSEPAPAPATALATTGDGPRDLDAHGFDPADYEWVPVRRMPRADGWSAEKQRVFIGRLADTGSVRAAARAVGMTAKSAYALRRAPDGAGFAQAWAAAVRAAMDGLLDTCLERAIEGTEEAVYDRDGRVIGHRTKHHDRMAMFLLRAHRPDLFGPARPHAPPVPVAEAVKAIDPVTPAEPHRLMAPDDLQAALQSADLLDGRLPHWLRDREVLAREESAEDVAALVRREAQAHYARDHWNG